MAGIHIDWTALEASFENHAPDVRTYLDRNTGELVTVTSDDTSAEAARVKARPEEHVRVEPVPSREQYRMMEQFIDTVTLEPLKEQLKDSIVGKGAFRRFKDAVGRYPEERKRWFAFRDVLLHKYILEWLKLQRVELVAVPDWSMELPDTPAPDEVAVDVPPPPLPADSPYNVTGDRRYAGIVVPAAESIAFASARRRASRRSPAASSSPTEISPTPGPSTPSWSATASTASART